MAAYSTGCPQSGSNQRSFEYDGCINLIVVDRYARTAIGTVPAAVVSLAPCSSSDYDYCRDYLRAMGAGGAALCKWQRAHQVGGHFVAVRCHGCALSPPPAPPS